MENNKKNKTYKNFRSGNLEVNNGQHDENKNGDYLSENHANPFNNRANIIGFK